MEEETTGDESHLIQHTFPHYPFSETARAYSHVSFQREFKKK